MNSVVEHAVAVVEHMIEVQQRVHSLEMVIQLRIVGKAMTCGLTMVEICNLQD